MVMLDTNMILRYLLNDNEEIASEAERVIKKEAVQVSIEIIAEVEIGRASCRERVSKSV